MPSKTNYKDFSARIRVKYPEYGNMDDLSLAKMWVEQNPQYGEFVVFDEPTTQKKSPVGTTPGQPVGSELVSSGDPIADRAQTQSAIKGYAKNKDKAEEIGFWENLGLNFVNGSNRFFNDAFQTAYEGSLAMQGVPVAGIQELSKYKSRPLKEDFRTKTRQEMGLLEESTAAFANSLPIMLSSIAMGGAANIATKAGKVAGGLPSFISGFQESGREADEIGIKDPLDRIAFQTAGGGMEFVSEYILPDASLIRPLRQRALKDLVRVGGKGLSKADVGRYVAEFTEKVAKEVGEEYAVEVGEALRGVSFAVAGYDSAMPEMKSARDYAVIALSAAIGAGTVGGVGTLADAAYARSTAIKKASENPEAAAQAVADLIEAGKLTEQQGNDFLTKVNLLSRASSRMPKNIDPEVAVNSAELLNQKMDIEEQINALEEEKKGVDDSFVPEIDTQIASLTEQLNSLTQQISSIRPTEPEGFTIELDIPDAVNLSTEDQSVLELMSSRFEEPYLNAINQRINNAEEISLSELENIAGDMINELAVVSEFQNLTDNQKQQLSQLVENQIDNLLNYEFATTTTTEQAGQKTKAAGIISTPREGRPLPESKVSRERFEGAGVRIGGRGAGRITVKPIEGFGGRSVYGISFGNRRGVTPVEDLEFDNLEFVAPVILEDGSFNARMRDSKTGLELTITDPELSIDLAIAESLRQAGKTTFPQPAFLEAFNEVTKGTPTQTTTFPNIGRTGTAPEAAGVQPQTEQDVRQETNVTQERGDEGEASSRVPQEEGRQEGQVTPAVEGEAQASPTAKKKTAQEKADEEKAKREKSAKILEKLKDALRSSKAKSGGGANIDLTFGVVPITKAVWNTAIDTAILAIDAGQTIAQAIKAASDYISSQIQGDWGKNKVSQYLEDLLDVTQERIKSRVSLEPLPDALEIIDGFYSVVERKVLDTLQEKQSATKWINALGKGDEVTYTGLGGWLASKRPDEQVSKKEILDWMKNNRIEVRVMVMGSESDNYIDRLMVLEQRQAQAIEDEDYVAAEFYERKINDLNDARVNEIGKTLPKFSQYQLEGEKEKYQEVLVTLPREKKLSEKENVVSQEILGKTLFSDEQRQLVYDEIERRKEYNKSLPNPFISSHFPESNILVHLRMNTRVDADGNKVLFLEEIQSDWGQKGKKYGFKSEDIYKKADEAYGRYLDKMKAKYGKDYDQYYTEEESYEEFILLSNRDAAENSKISSAPFVTDTNAWTKLGLKIALKEAVKQGADKIAWTTGEQQNERYDLSKQVDEVRYNPREKILRTKNVDGTQSVFENVSENKIEDYIGKEPAKNLINSELDKNGLKIIKGEGLKMGGKGMIGFYGSPTEGSLGIVGNVAKSLVKQEVGTVEINKGTDDLTKEDALKLLDKGEKVYTYNRGTIFRLYSKDDINEATNYFSKKGEAKSTQYSIDITPEVKAQVEAGIPLFDESPTPKTERVTRLRSEMTSAIEKAQEKPTTQPDVLKDVESTTKALDKKINVRKSSIAVRLRKLAGIIAHGGEDVISKFDFSKIKGGLRGRYGKGIYFSSLFKNYDYGDKVTYLDTRELNLMNGNMSVYEALNTLSLPSEIKRNIGVLENSLIKVKNNKDYNEISSEIKKLKSVYSKFDENSNYIERTLQKEADKNPSTRLDSILEALEARVMEANNLDTSRAIKGLEDSLNNMLIESGFDGINVDEGREILIFPQEKINDYIVQSQEKFISEAYHKAKKDGSNPELVKAVEDLLVGEQQQEKAEKPIAESRREFREKVRKYFDGMKRLGIAFDPERNAKEDIAFFKALKDYIKLEIDNGMVTFKGFIDKATALMPEFSNNELKGKAKELWGQAVVKEYPKLMAKYSKVKQQQLEGEIKEIKRDLAGRILKMTSPKAVNVKGQIKTEKRKLSQEAAGQLATIRDAFDMKSMLAMDPKDLLELYNLTTQIYKEGRSDIDALNEELNKQAASQGDAMLDAIASEGKRLQKLEDEAAARKKLSLNAGVVIAMNEDERVLLKTEKELDALEGKGYTFMFLNTKGDKYADRNFLMRFVSGRFRSAREIARDLRTALEFIKSPAKSSQDFINSLVEKMNKASVIKARNTDSWSSILKEARNRYFGSDLNFAYTNWMNGVPKVGGNVLEIRDGFGERIQGMTNAKIVTLYRQIMDPRNLVKPKGKEDGPRKINLTDESIQDIIDYMNLPQNEAGKGFALSLNGFFARVAEDVSQVLESNGYNADKLKEARYDKDKVGEEFIVKIMDQFVSMRPDGFIPYTPVQATDSPDMAQGVEIKEEDLLGQGDLQKNFSVISNNMITKEPTGQIIPTDIRQTLNAYTAGMANMSAKLPLLRETQAVFSKRNLTAMNNAFAPQFTENLKANYISYMTDRVVPTSSDKTSAAIKSWLMQSTAIPMFLNFKSGVLQLIATPNFLFSYDFSRYIDSSKELLKSRELYLQTLRDIIELPTIKQRYGGRFSPDSRVITEDANTYGALSIKIPFTNLKISAKELLSKGYAFSSFGDIITIALGGAPVYYDIKKTNKARYLSEGMSEKDAESKAKQDAEEKLYEIIQETQQSSDAMYLSQFQKQSVTRIFSSFATATMQYYRKARRASLRMKNKEGNQLQNAYEILHYTVINAAVFQFFSSMLIDAISGPGEDELEEMNRQERMDIVRYMEDVMAAVAQGTGAMGVVLQALILGLKESRNTNKPEKIIEAVLRTTPSVRAKYESAVNAMREWNRGDYVKSFTKGSEFVNIPADRIRALGLQVSDALTENLEFQERMYRLLGFRTESWMREKKQGEIWDGVQSRIDNSTVSERQRAISQTKEDYRTLFKEYGKKYAEAKTESERKRIDSIAAKELVNVYNHRNGGEEFSDELREIASSSIEFYSLPKDLQELKDKNQDKKVEAIVNEYIRLEKKDPKKADEYWNLLVANEIVSKNEIKKIAEEYDTEKGHR